MLPNFLLYEIIDFSYHLNQLNQDFPSLVAPRHLTEKGNGEVSKGLQYSKNGIGNVCRAESETSSKRIKFELSPKQLGVHNGTAAFQAEENAMYKVIRA